MRVYDPHGPAWGYCVDVPLTVHLLPGGSATFHEDYEVRVDGQAVTPGGTGTLAVVIPAGATYVDLSVIPLHDDKPEGDELITFDLLGGNTYDPHPDPAQRKATATLQNRTGYEIVATNRIDMKRNSSQIVPFKVLRNGVPDGQKNVTTQVVGGIPGDSATTGAGPAGRTLTVSTGGGNAGRSFIVNLIIDDEKHVILVAIDPD